MSPGSDYDLRQFVCTGARLDVELLATDPGSITGPENWLTVWRHAGQEIVGCWPAVRTVARAAMISRRAMSHADVSALAVDAMAWHAAHSCEPDIGGCR
jgi:hypothetical protein